MGWTIAVGLVLALGLHACLLLARPGPRVVAALGYVTLALVALAFVCAASVWSGAETVRARDLAVRSAMDRDFVMLIHAIDAARDTACNTPPPKSTDATLLAAYARMRTTCAYYATVWIEAARVSDLPEVLAAAETPWPSSGSPKQQFWSYGPLKAEVSRVEAALHRPEASATGFEARLAEALPFVLAGLLAASLSTVTAGLLAVTRSLG